MEQEATQVLAGLAKRAMGALEEFFDSGAEVDSKAIGRARVASSVLSAWARERATQSATETRQVLMARELAENKEQLELYLKAAMPSAPVVKAIPERVPSQAQTAKKR